ncbi:MAG TPA: translation initiation factor IF-3 [Luteibaculaceae bacterium]|nr:translation initiation factor IF-3 [Luteibaculaceae bacterium]
MQSTNFQGRRNQRPVEKENQHRINHYITAREVRLVGENVEPKVYSTSDALKLAQELELDLVEISPNAAPPVCKVMDYQKFLYDQKRKQKELKSKQVNVVIKEIRFGPNTSEHDLNFKLNHAKKFLEEGSKVKAYVFFKGRSIVFKERGELLLLNFVNELEEFGVAESMPQLEGKKMIIMINPKKKK